MKKHNKIKALFFLGIFSLLLLHQVVPHLHHQYDSEHSHNDVVQNDHHHHHLLEKSISTKGFLHLFLEAHEHSLVSCEALFAQKNILKQLNVKKDVKTSIFLNRYCISINYDDESEKVSVYHPPNTYFNRYLSSLDSRGPPSLG